MILVTGGLGFIGSHTSRALLDLGQSCVIARRSDSKAPAFLAGGDSGDVVIEQMDCTDLESVLAVGRRHEITGIMHLASAGLGQGDPVNEVELGVRSTITMLRAAQEWGIGRMVQASTIGVYAGVEDEVFREDRALPVMSSRALQAYKKAAEIIANAVASESELDVVSVRVAAVWGPLGRERSPFFGLPQLVHHTLRDADETVGTLHADDGIDAIYVRDCARAIALLQVADTLSHQTYNVGSGRVTTNRDVVESLNRTTGQLVSGLLPGRSPHLPPIDAHMDISRLRGDTGFVPDDDLDRGIGEYVAWLDAGHDR